MTSPQPAWLRWIEQNLPLYGHRNWIVVADAAYPAQSREGIETLATGEGHQTVVKVVLARLSASRHIRPIVHTDREMAFVDDRDASGIEAYRGWLENALVGLEPRSSPHEDLIARLDEAAQLFRIVILKTEMAIPYTSVFFELDCGYWDANAERRLREAMQR